eukprot:1148738-Pelagomonas_calceolata.AAC.3
MHSPHVGPCAYVSGAWRALQQQHSTKACVRVSGMGGTNACIRTSGMGETCVSRMLGAYVNGRY